MYRTGWPTVETLAEDVVCFSFLFWPHVLDKAEYSVFESTLNSAQSINGYIPRLFMCSYSANTSWSSATGAS